MDLHFNNDVSFHKLAKISGLDRRIITRRANRLIHGLLADEYITVRRYCKQFSREQLDVAYDRYLLGLSYHSIAKKRHITQRAAQTILKKLDLWLKTKLNPPHKQKN